MEFFAEHFIAMAARSIEFNAYGQGNYYSRVLNESIGTLEKNSTKNSKQYANFLQYY